VIPSPFPDAVKPPGTSLMPDTQDLLLTVVEPPPELKSLNLPRIDLNLSGDLFFPFSQFGRSTFPALGYLALIRLQAESLARVC